MQMIIRSTSTRAGLIQLHPIKQQQLKLKWYGIISNSSNIITTSIPIRRNFFYSIKYNHHYYNNKYCSIYQRTTSLPIIENRKIYLINNVCDNTIINLNKSISLRSFTSSSISSLKDGDSVTKTEKEEITSDNTDRDMNVLYDSKYTYKVRHMKEALEKEEEGKDDVSSQICSRKEVSEMIKNNEKENKIVLLDLRNEDELQYDPPIENAVHIPVNKLSNAIKLDEEVWKNRTNDIIPLSQAECVIVYSNPENYSECADAVRKLIDQNINAKMFLGGAREWNKFNNFNHEIVHFISPEL